MSEDQTGGALRKELEKALADLNTLKTSNAEHMAEKVIRDAGLEWVTASDLAGVPTAEMVAKATELDTAKAAEAERLAA